MDLCHAFDAQMNDLAVYIHGAPIILAMPKNFDAVRVCH